MTRYIVVYLNCVLFPCHQRSTSTDTQLSTRLCTSLVYFSNSTSLMFSKPKHYFNSFISLRIFYTTQYFHDSKFNSTHNIHTRTHTYTYIYVYIFTCSLIVIFLTSYSNPINIIKAFNYNFKHLHCSIPKF